MATSIVEPLSPAQAVPCPLTPHQRPGESPRSAAKVVVLAVRPRASHTGEPAPPLTSFRPLDAADRPAGVATEASPCAEPRRVKRGSENDGCRCCLRVEKGGALDRSVLTPRRKQQTFHVARTQPGIGMRDCTVVEETKHKSSIGMLE